MNSKTEEALFVAAFAPIYLVNLTVDKAISAKSAVVNKIHDLESKRQLRNSTWYKNQKAQNKNK